MESKHKEIQAKIYGLIEFTLMKMDQYSNGEITEEHLNAALKFIDTKHEEIQAEIAVMELLESISLN